MNNKGFSLITVLVLSLVIFLIGGTGLYIASTSFRATRADVNYNIAEKASNSGLLDAFDYINMTGGGERIHEEQMENSSYKNEIALGGKNVLFVRSAGAVKDSNAKVIKTALFQGYYGVGLYTVRGKVIANIGNTRFSGCDAVPEPNCNVPAFIASGTIKIPDDVKPQACTAAGATDGNTAGLYGAPAIYNIDQGDLSKIFFKVQCFNKFVPPGTEQLCKISLLDYLEWDYGDKGKDFSFQQDLNKTGIPVFKNTWTVPSAGAGCTYPVTMPSPGSLSLDLSATTSCDVIVINSSLTDVTVTGDGTRSGQRVKIYTNDASTAMTFSNASNFILYTTGITTFNDTNSLFSLYTKGVTNLNETITGTSTNPFKIVSTNTINTGTGATLTNGMIIAAPTDVLETNDVNSPQNLVSSANANISIDNVNIFARSLRWGYSSKVKILNSLIYVYAYACPDNCSRITKDSSYSACVGKSLWCGLSGSNISLNLGMDDDNTAKPVLFISNNSTIKAVNPSANIWGVWYGEDVTYLAVSPLNFNGFFIRNFPQEGPELAIDINSGLKLNFSKEVIDAISNKYRFFRQVECIRDPLTPKAQLIQTRMTSY